MKAEAGDRSDQRAEKIKNRPLGPTNLVVLPFRRSCQTAFYKLAKDLRRPYRGSKALISAFDREPSNSCKVQKMRLFASSKILLTVSAFSARTCTLRLDRSASSLRSCSRQSFVLRVQNSPSTLPSNLSSYI